MKKKVPKVRVNKSLNKYADVVLFPEKVAEANETLRRYRLPETPKQKSKKSSTHSRKVPV